ncbi:hypothetical protein H6P81_010667 [Aristolochia fimbriata]|uniref:Uncharacterized protein n=1 Tax=Aristolochia fimbriata TaxID=158543 RepID=A0AAV7EST3_ARIFI|nr:hypothetical protein H6P81_010667 [Aristolochia fimbriata]
MMDLYRKYGGQLYFWYKKHGGFLQGKLTPYFGVSLEDWEYLCEHVFIDEAFKVIPNPWRFSRYIEWIKKIIIYNSYCKTNPKKIKSTLGRRKCGTPQVRCRFNEFLQLRKKLVGSINSI